MGTTRRKALRQRIQDTLDSYGVLCTLSNEKPLSDALADAILKIYAKPRTRKKPDADLYKIARSLATVCLIDFESNKDKLFAEARRLTKATPMPTTTLVIKHYNRGGTWYREDWRGKGGQAPTLGQVRLTWAKLVGGLTVEAGTVREFTV